MNVVQRSFICLTLIMSGVSLLTAEGDPCIEAGRDLLIVESDFAPESEIGYTPFELLDESSTPEKPLVNGFDVQVAAQIAHRLGFKEVKFQQTPFGEILSRIAANPTRIGIAAISATKERQKNTDISFIPYNSDTLGILLSNDLFNPATSKDLSSGETVLATLNTLGVPLNIGITTTNGSRENSILTDSVYPNIDSEETKTLEQAIDLATTIVDFDGLFTDEATAQDIVKRNLMPNFTLISNVQFETSDSNNNQNSDGLAVVVNRECCQLYADIVQAIKDMEADGTLPKLRERFNIPNAFSLVEITPTECANTQSDIDSNDISNFLFTKQCAGPIPVT